jgi:hypothetical protein
MVTQLRAFGLRPSAAMTADQIAEAARAAGQLTAARLLLSQVELLWRRQIIQYILLRAVRP